MILAVLALAAAYELRAGVTPVQKVIKLLQDMQATSTQEKKDEEVAFASFKTWCDHTTKTKQESIAKAEALMEQYEAEIQAAESDVAMLTEAMADLDAEMDGYKKDMKAATEVRDKEHADYQTTHKDYTESVDAVSRAAAVLSSQSADVSQAALLLQEVVKNHRVPIVAKRTFTAFVTSNIKDPFDEDAHIGLSVSAPQANAYEFQSGGVVDMLKKLKDKFEDERTQLEKEEMSQKQAYEMLIQDLTDSVERATAAKRRKAKTRGQRAEDAATAKGELADTTAVRDSDQKYLDETVSGCQLKSADYEDRQQLRAEEAEALAKAIEILSSGSVSGAADKHLPALDQQSVALALRASAATPARRAAEFLQTRAAKIHSNALSLLAAKVQAGDPFDKVRKMIKDMIVRLMEEANQETEHKGWCDTELGTNKLAREAKTEDVNSLSAQADQLTADIAKLAQEVADLTNEVAELDAAVKEATDIRTKESAKNAATVKDAQEASEAVQQATAVLKDFYAKAAEATALVQAPSAMDDAPATFDSPYQGDQAASGGVLGMLEVIASDFSRLETDTTMAEEQAAKEFTKFTNEAAVDRATKAADIKNKQKLSTKKNGELQQTKTDLKATQEELDAALAYYDKLKPSCVDAGVSYEERVQRREEEIESLQEALKILSGEDI